MLNKTKDSPVVYVYPFFFWNEKIEAKSETHLIIALDFHIGDLKCIFYRALYTLFLVINILKSAILLQRYAIRSRHNIITRHMTIELILESEFKKKKNSRR